MFFCIQQKKETHTGLEQLDRMTEFSFLGELSQNQLCKLNYGDNFCCKAALKDSSVIIYLKSVQFWFSVDP